MFLGNTASVLKVAAIACVLLGHNKVFGTTLPGTVNLLWTGGARGWCYFSSGRQSVRTQLSASGSEGAFLIIQQAHITQVRNVAPPPSEDSSDLTYSAHSRVGLAWPYSKFKICPSVRRHRITRLFILFFQLKLKSLNVKTVK